MKLITPEARDAAASRAIRPQRRDDAIREKQLAPYIPMVCGHLTTREEIDFFSLWQPKRGRYWCQICGRWKDAYKAPKAQTLPDDPMF